jgi:hypothetical protein
MKKQIHIFDNNGETVDRYTAIVSKSGDVYGFNSNPFHPLGFGQFCGNVTDRMNVSYGAMWRKRFNEKKVLRLELKHYLSEAKNCPEWLGKPVSIEELPEKAQQYISQILKD